MRISLASLLFLFLPTGSAVAAATSDPHLESVKEIFAWVNGAKDGFVTSKQSVRRMVENDTSTPLMVYATEDIQEGELLVQTPWSHIIRSKTPAADDHYGWHCGTAYKLKEEILKGKDSFYAPYTTYVNDEPEGQLPSRYSTKAKKLLEQVIGSHPDELNRSPLFNRDDASDQRLSPEALLSTMDTNFYESCRPKRSDKLADKAAELLMLRGDDHIMIPAYDAYNHRNNDKHNGKVYMNAMTETTPGEHHQTFAKRDIQKGEQIFISYNMCDQCQARSHSGFGTAEMFREYGFVEWFPQRWYYRGFGDWDPEENELELNQFDLYQNEETKDLTIVWTHLSESDDKLERFKVFLAREIRRLKRLKNIEWADMYSWTEDQWEKSGISSLEWSNINQFLDANILAMTVAVEDLTMDAPRPLTISQDDLQKLLNDSHYDTLSEPEMDDLPYYKYTCDNEEFFEFLGFIDTENAFWTDRDQLLGYFESYFFNQNVEDVNACYDVMNTVQMCSSFRPYHHEYMTHIPARYIQSLKRVAIVGNGDSMLLHEIMKYPDIELVVGLELDQTVTRKSFKHFKTDPYFHDPRVDWWFGNATKSVLVLPDSYWGSFDLVLVDLGTNTLDTDVTEDLTLFESLTRLVNPDTGIMVRNDLGLEKVSSAFDHSMQIFYDLPAICSENVAIGSNGIDFFDAPIYDHGVADMGNLLYTLSSDEAGERHDLVHDYRSKPCQMQGSQPVASDAEEEQTKTNGIIEFLSLEHLKTPPNSFESISKSLKTVIEGVDGFSVIENGVFFDDDEKLALIIMEEGYVAARMQHDENAVDDAENAFYLGFDVYLWSRMHLSQKLKESVLKAFESDEVSSFKLVTGGLFGAKNWKDDVKHIGPTVPTLPTKTCGDKNVDTSAKSAFDAEAAGGITVEEVLSLTNSQSVVVAVVCGSENDTCTSLNVLKKQELVKELVPIHDCASGTEDHESAYACENNVIKELSSKLDSGKKLNMLVLDSSASQQMHQIVNSIFETYENRQAFLRWHNVFVSWSSKNVASSVESWRKEFLDRYRKQIHRDPVKMSDFEIVSGDDAYAFGVVSTNDSGAAQKMDTFRKSLQNRLPDGTLVALRNMHGGMFQYKDPSNHNPKEFFAREYDQSAGEEHFEKQVPLAVQTVLQYEGNDQMKEQASRGIGMECNFAEKLVYGSTMKEGLLDDTSKQTLFQYTVGDGCVVLMIGKSFNAISVWDGKVNLDLNFFAVSTGEKTPSAAYVDMALREFAPFVKVSTDAQPRGLGNIVNMAEDLVSIDRASIAAGLGEDKEEPPIY